MKYFISEALLNDSNVARKDFGITINSTCNLRCPYCLSQDVPCKGDMTQGAFNKILNKLQEAKSDCNCCILGGEPTLHPRFYDFVNDLAPLVERCVILTNGTIPIKHKPQPSVLYQLSLHETQAKQKHVSTFIENCKKLLDWGAQFEVLLTFETPLGNLVERALTELGAGANIRQLHIDLANSEHRAKNCHSDSYVLNGKGLTYERVIKLRLNRFKGWWCNIIDFNVLQDGKVHLSCHPDLAIPIEDIDMNKNYFIKCKVKECTRECYLESLKFRT